MADAQAQDDTTSPDSRISTEIVSDVTANHDADM
jgi:hypothetical protein